MHDGGNDDDDDYKDDDDDNMIPNQTLHNQASIRTNHDSIHFVHNNVVLISQMSCFIPGSTLTSTAYFLATHPEVQDRLTREIDELIETSGDEPLYEMVQKAG